MRTLYRRCMITSFVGAAMLLVQLTPVGARDRDNGRHSLTVGFSKWMTVGPLMAGVTRGDAVGQFAGEVLQQQISANGHVVRLEAVYEVIAGGHSFTALVRGGVSGITGAAVLDGTILAGWRRGSPVHIEFQTKTAPSANQPACTGGPPGVECYVGTIDIASDAGGSRR